MSATLRSIYRLASTVCCMALCISPFLLRVESFAQSTNNRWTPFVSRFVEEQSPSNPNASYNLIMDGVYLRNSQGASYNRRTVRVHGGSPLALPFLLDMAFLRDRASPMTYSIDYLTKTIKQAGDPPGNLDFSVGPLSRTEFDARHVGDRFLGKKTLSGVDCEGYKVPDSHHEGTYSGEEWFAPSLDFMAVRFQGRLPSGEKITMMLKDIKTGKEPDPHYFVLPGGFKRVN